MVQNGARLRNVIDPGGLDVVQAVSSGKVHTLVSVEIVGAVVVFIWIKTQLAVALFVLVVAPYFSYVFVLDGVTIPCGLYPLYWDVDVLKILDEISLPLLNVSKRLLVQFVIKLLNDVDNFTWVVRNHPTHVVHICDDPVAHVLETVAVDFGDVLDDKGTFLQGVKLRRHVCKIVRVVSRKVVS
tara:strand:+ start:184 stop:735 length:552 start_codon:yes stop_codon:yes gene_type:complete